MTQEIPDDRLAELFASLYEKKRKLMRNATKKGNSVFAEMVAKITAFFKPSASKAKKEEERNSEGHSTAIGDIDCDDIDR